MISYHFKYEHKYEQNLVLRAIATELLFYLFLKLLVKSFQ